MPLPPAPPSVEDSLGAPRFGTYQGSLASARLGGLRGTWQPSRLARLAVHKRWLYGFVATREVAVLFAVVDLGYSSNVFTMAVELAGQRVLVDVGRLGPPRPLVKVNEYVGAGLEVGLRLPGASVHARRPFGDERYHVDIRLGLGAPVLRPSMVLRAELLAAGAAPPLTVIAPVEGGDGVNVTQKWAALQAFGELEVAGHRYRLDGGVGGLDSTHGYLARRTAWRWAFVCGRLDDGTPVGINLVEGFNETRDDVNENALWLGGRLYGLGRARFTWNHDDVLDRWHVRTTDGVLDLTFKPIAAHRELRDLVVVRSRFSQPVGTWSGTITLEGQRWTLDAQPGVAEDQDVLW